MVKIGLTNLLNPLQFRGTIAVNSDFPTSAEVQPGWFFIVTADVTDDDASKTNTGLSFQSKDEIVWNGSTWVVMGNTKDVDYVQFELTPDVAVTRAEGKLWWNDDDKTLNLGMAGNEVNLQIGQELYIPRAKNVEGSQIDNGEVVFVFGASGVNPTVKLANATDHDISNATIAVATEDIGDNQNGYFTAFGLVRDIDTSSFVAGAELFLSATPGQITDTVPISPDSRVCVGKVIRSHASEGSIFVDIQPIPNLEELSDVLVSSVDDFDLLQWNAVSGIWENETVNSVIAEQFVHGDASDMPDTGGTNEDHDLRYPLRTEWLQNGFVDNNDVTITWSDSTPNYTLTVAPTVSIFEYFVQGVKYTKSDSETLQIDGTEGLHYIYYDDDTLTEVVNPSDAIITNLWETKASVSIVYWDATNSKHVLFADERHESNMAPQTHSYLHFTRGAQFFSGLALNTFDIDGNGDDTTAAQFGVDAGNIVDEDITINPSAVVSTTGLPIFYKDGASGNWRVTVNSGFSVRTFDGTSNTRLAWNEFTGGAWQLSLVDNGDFVLCHVFCTNDVDTPLVAIMGQSEYNNANQARNGAADEILNIVTSGLPTPEIVPIGSVIFQTSNTYDNAVKGRTRTSDTGDNYVDFRFSEVSGTTSPDEHGNLAGLTDDDHLQYHNDARGDARYLAWNNVSEVVVPGLGYVDVDIGKRAYDGKFDVKQVNTGTSNSVTGNLTSGSDTTHAIDSSKTWHELGVLLITGILTSNSAANTLNNDSSVAGQVVVNDFAHDLTTNEWGLITNIDGTGKILTCTNFSSAHTLNSIIEFHYGPVGFSVYNVTRDIIAGVTSYSFASPDTLVHNVIAGQSSGDEYDVQAGVTRKSWDVIGFDVLIRKSSPISDPPAGTTVSIHNRSDNAMWFIMRY